MVESSESASGAARLLDAARGAMRSYRTSFAGGDDDVVRLPEAAAVELIRKLASAVSSTVQQIVPFTPLPDAVPAALRDTVRSGRFAPPHWELDEFSQVVTRMLAARQRRVERLYLLPPGHVASRTVEHRLRDDEHSANMESRCLRIGDVTDGRQLSEPTSQTPMSAVWIVDERAVIFQEATPAGPPVWTVSAKPDVVQQAAATWSQLWSSAASTVPRQLADLDDPLIVSAEQMAAAAPMSCTTRNGSLRHCDWYHGAWQYLRLFNMVSSPRWHHDFYLEAFAKVLSERARHRVLISGAADYSMLAYVLYALRAARPDAPRLPAVDVLDQCATPLNACRWYARLTDHDVNVHEMDILAPRTEAVLGRYDLIATDAFLTRFSLDECERILDTWRRLLAPGGSVVTTIRIHPYDTPRDGVSDEVSDFVTRARQAAQRWRPYLRASVDEIAADARRYAERITSSDLGDEEEISQLFKSHGFDITGLSVEPMAGELCHTHYLRVIARRQRY